jgi:hypothetical protein
MEGAAAEYDELMRSLAGKPPLPRGLPPGVPRRAQRQAQDLLHEEAQGVRRGVPDFYDNDLRRLFKAPMVRASTYLRRHRKDIENAVCQWTTEKKYRSTGW